MLKKKKSLSFLVLFVFLASSVFAVAPTVDFNWTPTNPYALSTVTFDPEIVSAQNLDTLYWMFGADGNVNYDANTVDSQVLLYNFASGSSGWNTTGTWSTASGYFSTSTSDGNASYVLDDNYSLADTNATFYFKQYIAASTNNGRTFFAVSGTNISQLNGYYIEFRNAESKILLRKVTSGISSTILDAGAIITGAFVDINVNVFDGNFLVYVNGAYKGNIVDTDFTDYNTLVLFNSDTAAESRWDDFNFTNTTVSIIDPDKNEEHVFPSSGVKQVCLTASNEDGAASICKNVTVLAFLENPVITRFDVNASYGIGITDLNAHFILGCDSNALSVNYVVVLNGVTVYDFNAAPTDSNYFDITTTNGLNTASFTCRAGAGSVLESKTFTLYSILVLLVNEQTGAPLTDFNPYTSLTGTDYNTGTVYDFKASGNDVNISSLGDTTFRIDINYVNGLYLYKEFTMSVLSPDAAPEICVADLNNSGFAEQIFTSSVRDGVVLRHSINKCYSLAAYTNYSYLNGLRNTAFTIAQPYTIYFFDGNIKTILDSVDGAVGASHSLLAMRINQTDFDVSIITDTIAVSPVKEDDENFNTTGRLQVFSRSSNGGNTALTLSIYNGLTLLWTYTESDNPNLVLVNVDINGWGVTDENILKLVVSKTNAQNEITVTNHYFSVGGIQYGNTLNPFIAIILGLFVLIFGLTLVSARFAFSWFGILVAMLAFALVALAPMYWYVKFFSAIVLIVLVYIVMVYKNETSRVV